MQTATFLGVLLAAVVSLLLVFWQYYFRSSVKSSKTHLLAILRWMSLFGVLLLVINPKIKKSTLLSEKQNLVLLVDNSKSMRNAGAGDQAREWVAELLKNDRLPDRFNIRDYAFGRGLFERDSLDFNAEVSDISGALSATEAVYGRDKAVVVLLTDGNQTIGKEYEFMGSELHFPVYSVVVGDTTTYTDLKISRVNMNKYAFLNNTFPLEIFLTYDGSGEVTSRLTISLEDKVVFSQDVKFTPEQNSQKISTSLKAQEVGFKTLQFDLAPLPGERNKANNRWRTSFEVIDEKTRIGIVSEVAHPDIGALIKAVESNEQRSATLLKPQAGEAELSEFDLLILFHPGRTFIGVYDYLEKSGMNSFTLTGPGTDWRYLNGVLKGLEVNSFNQAEELMPVVNPAFSLFDISDFSVEDFPPLKGSLGEVLITRPSESILQQQVKGIVLQEPLFLITSDEGGRQAYLFGENIWKWRVQSFINDRNFENFDNLINKVIFYLTSDGKRERLNVNYETVYTAVSDRTIKASYFDATFVFDSSAELRLDIRGVENEVSTQQNMVLSNMQYEADLRDLSPGEYVFSVTVEGENLKREGRFRIEDFNLEDLFISSNYAKLQQLSEGSGGALFFPEQEQVLIEKLTEDPQFAPVQKSIENVVSLIDFKLLLGLIILALTAEWFIRKYTGLI